MTLSLSVYPGLARNRTGLRWVRCKFGNGTAKIIQLWCLQTQAEKQESCSLFGCGASFFWFPKKDGQPPLRWLEAMLPNNMFKMPEESSIQSVGKCPKTPGGGKYVPAAELVHMRPIPERPFGGVSHYTQHQVAAQRAGGSKPRLFHRCEPHPPGSARLLPLPRWIPSQIQAIAVRDGPSSGWQEVTKLGRVKTHGLWYFSAGQVQFQRRLWVASLCLVAWRLENSADVSWSLGFATSATRIFLEMLFHISLLCYNNCMIYCLTSTSLTDTVLHYAARSPKRLKARAKKASCQSRAARCRGYSKVAISITWQLRWVVWPTVTWHLKSIIKLCHTESFKRSLLVKVFFLDAVWLYRFSPTTINHNPGWFEACSKPSVSISMRIPAHCRSIPVQRVWLINYWTEWPKMTVNHKLWQCMGLHHETSWVSVPRGPTLTFCWPWNGNKNWRPRSLSSSRLLTGGSGTRSVWVADPGRWLIAERRRSSGTDRWFGDLVVLFYRCTFFFPKQKFWKT